MPEHEHFVDACLRGAPLRSDGRFGLKTQARLLRPRTNQGRKAAAGSRCQPSAPEGTKGRRDKGPREHVGALWARRIEHKSG